MKKEKYSGTETCSKCGKTERITWYSTSKEAPLPAGWKLDPKQRFFKKALCPECQKVA